jgi:hypothetical protein
LTLRSCDNHQLKRNNERAKMFLCGKNFTVF